jgi:2-dehydropantoate 2-reductase
MRITVIGCGGIGGVVAGILGSQGSDVLCVDVDKTTVRRINESGIELHGKMGEVEAGIKAVGLLSDEEGKFDLIVIAVKSMYLKEVFEHYKDFLSKDGFILTLQNGIEILEIVKDFQEVKTIAGAVGYNSQIDENGEYNVTAKGGITIGNLTTGSDEDLIRLKKIFDPGIMMDINRNITGVLWSKLLVVLGVTGLGGCTGLRLGPLLMRKKARRLFYQVVTEGVSVSKELGIELEKFGRVINPKKFGNNKEGYPLFVRFLILNVIVIMRWNIKSNIQVDIELGRRTEVDFINGAVVKAGKALGIDTPVNQEIVRMVKEIEQDNRNMSPRNLREIFELNKR